MPFATGQDLYDEIASWLDRDDLNEEIPTIVFLAEIGVARELKIEGSLVVVPGTLNQGDQGITLPADCFEPRALTLFLPTTSNVDIVHPAEYNLRRGQDGSMGTPEVARVRGNQLIVSPISNGNYPYEFEYISGVGHVAADGTSQLLTVAPDVLLWSSLILTGQFGESDDRVATYTQNLSTVLPGAKRQMARLRHGAGPLRQRYHGSTP